MDVRKAWAILAAVLGGLTIFCGLVLDVPQAIHQLLTRAPEWAQSHDAHWALGVAAVVGVVIFVILRCVPSGSPQNVSLSEMTSELEWMARAAANCSKFNNIREKVLRYPSEADNKFYSEYLTTVVPAEIENVAGKDAKIRYLEILVSARDLSSNVRLHFDAVAPFVTTTLFDAEKNRVKVSPEVAAKKVDPPLSTHISQ
jgi:hypothetical protein